MTHRQPLQLELLGEPEDRLGSPDYPVYDGEDGEVKPFVDLRESYQYFWWARRALQRINSLPFIPRIDAEEESRRVISDNEAIMGSNEEHNQAMLINKTPKELERIAVNLPF